MKPTSLGLKALFLALAASLAWLPSPAPAQAPRPPALGVQSVLDVRYFPDHDRQVLDIFRPRGVDGAPVVLFVHGGTWLAGDKDFGGLYRQLGRYLASQGIVAVLINYRLSPLVRHPEHVKDVARAFAWTVRNIGRHGGDPRRVVLCGHSAGGHLVSLLATSDRYLNDSALRLTAAERRSLKGVISASGIYRIPGTEEFRSIFEATLDAVIGSDEALKPSARTLRSGLMFARELINPFRIVFGATPGVQTEASPLTHVRRGQPPFLLLLAEREVAGLRLMARDFAAALRKVEVPVEVREMEGYSHYSMLFHTSDPTDTVGPVLVRFVMRHAGRPTS